MDTPLGSCRLARNAMLTVLVTLLVGCGGGYGSGGMSNTPTNTTISGAILPTLAMTTTIGSTVDPTEQGDNPYGLTVATATGGPIMSGDLIACNFNDGASHTEGMGTTVVGLHPMAGAKPYRIAQSAELLGCSSLTSLPDGSLVATGSQANATVVISTAGNVTTLPAADAFAHPWSAIYATHGGNAYVYVSNATTGTIDRITLNGDVQSSFTEIATGFSTNLGKPGSISAPAGLTYDAATDTLYVVDTNTNLVISLSNVSAIEANGVMVTSDTVAGATFAGASAASAKVIAKGSPLNGPISGALLVNGDLVVGNTLADPAGTNLMIEISPSTGKMVSMNVDPGVAGAIFGIVAVRKTITTMGAYGSTNTLTNVIYFNDDNDNTVKLLAQ